MMYPWSGYDDGLKTASVTVLYDCFIIFSCEKHHRGDEEGHGGTLIANLVVIMLFTAMSNTLLIAHPLHQL